MDDRAIELYNQAAAFAYHKIGKEHVETAYFQGVVAGKFAELLLKDVLNTIDESQGDIDFVKWKINKDFGVE